MYGLTSSDFFKIVKQHFRFLLDQYGFSIIEERSAPTLLSRAVALQRKDLCIEIWQEHLSVGLFLFPCSEGKRRGLNVAYLITFLDREDGKPVKELQEGRFGPDLDQALDDRSKIIFQLDWYANRLRPYLDRIFALYEPGIFQKREAELMEWEGLWQKQIRKALAQWVDQHGIRHSD